MTALQRGPHGSWSPSLLHELRVASILPDPFLLISFLVVSQGNHLHLVKDVELPWGREMTPNPTRPGASLPTAVDPISLQTVSFYDCKHR